MSASVKSIEDHGYILNLGIPDVSGFLSFKDAKKAVESSSKLPVGSIIDVSISKLPRERTCDVTISLASRKFSHVCLPLSCPVYSVNFAFQLNKVTNVTSILPGELVQCLITGISPLGLNVQVLGYFDGTIDEYHLPPGDPTENFKAGKKVKARVLYEIPGTSPPRFALSLVNHIVSLEPKSISAGGDGEVTGINEAYPIGTILDAVKIVKVEAERGLLVDVQDSIQGFVHVGGLFAIPSII